MFVNYYVLKLICEVNCVWDVLWCSLMIAGLVLWLQMDEMLIELWKCDLDEMNYEKMCMEVWKCIWDWICDVDWECVWACDCVCERGKDDSGNVWCVKTGKLSRADSYPSLWDGETEPGG